MAYHCIVDLCFVRAPVTVEVSVVRADNAYCFVGVAGGVGDYKGTLGNCGAPVLDVNDFCALCGLLSRLVRPIRRKVTTIKEDGPVVFGQAGKFQYSRCNVNVRRRLEVDHAWEQISITVLCRQSYCSEVSTYPSEHRGL